MPFVTPVFEAIAETTVFLDHFKELPDPRQTGKIVYRLDELLLLSLLALLAGAENFTDIARFGECKLALLRRFLPYANGTPPHDRIGEIYAALDVDVFQKCFVRWVAAMTNTPAEVISIDGKTMRRSGSKRNAKAPIHMVSAFAARQRLVLAQTKVDDKSNEITAIPALLNLLDIEGAVITIDAMGCQREIAQRILDGKADYILALKGNQTTLREDVELFVNEQKSRQFKDTKISTHRTVDADHGRIETRIYTVIHDVDWLQERHQWPGLKAVIVVESTRETGTKIEHETRFYITSLTLPAEHSGPMTRDHWAIENGLHWVMDMTFRDDECRIRTGNAPANFTTVRHMAQNLIRKAPAKASLRLKRKTAAWDDTFLISLIAPIITFTRFPWVEKALALASAQAGLSEDQMSQVMLGQLDGMLAIVGNEAFTQQVSQAAKAFFENPQNLSVEAKPSNPVPVVQILGNVQLAPQTLPDLLGVQVEANR